MEILKIYKIGGLSVSVTFSKDVYADESKMGYFSPRTQSIVLWADMADQLKQMTLVHELLEALNFIYSIRLKHEQINVLANALYQLLEDNYFGAVAAHEKL